MTIREIDQEIQTEMIMTEIEETGMIDHLGDGPQRDIYRGDDHQKDGHQGDSHQEDHHGDNLQDDHKRGRDLGGHLDTLLTDTQRSMTDLDHQREGRLTGRHGNSLRKGLDRDPPRSLGHLTEDLQRDKKLQERGQLQGRGHLRDSHQGDLEKSKNLPKLKDHL